MLEKTTNAGSSVVIDVKPEGHPDQNPPNLEIPQGLADRMKRQETDIESLRERVLELETKQARGGSCVRTAALTALTFVSLGTWMAVVLDDPRWYLAAVVPTGGYFISTLNLPTCFST